MTPLVSVGVPATAVTVPVAAASAPSTSPPAAAAPLVRRGLPVRNSVGSAAATAVGAPPPFLIRPIPGIPNYYPQSLWVEEREGKVDMDRMTSKSTYRLLAHKRLVAGRYVDDPDLKDFSNPRYRGPKPVVARPPAQTRFSRIGEFLGTVRARPAPLPGRLPQLVYATPIAASPIGARGSATGTALARSATGSSMTSTVATTDCEYTNAHGECDVDDYDGDDYDDCEELDEDEDGSPTSSASRRPPRAVRREECAGSGTNAVRAGGASVRAQRSSASTVKQTYTVVEPAYPFSSASYFFPIYYGRPSPDELADPRGLPQKINEVLHPNDRANMPLTSIAVQKDNLNRMSLFKIGPGAVAFKVVIAAFEAAGMKYTTSNSTFNILWAKRATRYTLASLTPYQKVNHFPGTWGIGRKDSLAQNMNKMRRYFGEHAYDIVPASFLLPRQEYELNADAERCPGTAENPLIYIMKPTASSCGRGIELCQGVPPMPRGGKQMVCQRYIGNPLLIYGRKFDLRIYCVVTSFDPLRVYLFDEGLVRFAAEKYPGCDKNLDNIHMHLTNYSVNKTVALQRQSSGKEYDTDDPLDIKWCISDFKKYLLKHHPQGLEAWAQIQRECDDVVIKTLLSIENDVIERIRYECVDKTGRNCFELFGLDLMVDDQLKVRLIEANIMPSLATASSLDKAVKSRMIAHMLTLVRAIPYRRNAIRAPKAEDRGTRRPPQAPEAAPTRGRSRSSTGARSDGSRHRRSVSDASNGRSPRGRGARAGEEDAASNDEEQQQHQQAGTGGAPPATAEAETFVPHGAVMDRPERTYRFGRHPLAGARIMEKPLLKMFNDWREPESMLTPYETLMVVESEEELRCAGGFRRVFPVKATVHNYLPLFTHGVRRNNFVLISAVAMQSTEKPKTE